MTEKCIICNKDYSEYLNNKTNYKLKDYCYYCQRCIRDINKFLISYWFIYRLVYSDIMKFVNGKQVKTCPRCNSANLGFSKANCEYAFNDQKTCQDCGFKADFW